MHISSPSERKLGRGSRLDGWSRGEGLASEVGMEARAAGGQRRSHGPGGRGWLVRGAALRSDSRCKGVILLSCGAQIQREGAHREL